MAIIHRPTLLLIALFVIVTVTLVNTSFAVIGPITSPTFQDPCPGQTVLGHRSVMGETQYVCG